MADGDLLVVVCFRKAEGYRELGPKARENWLTESSLGVVYGPFTSDAEARKELRELDEQHSCDGPHLVARLETPYVGTPAIDFRHIVEFSETGYGLQHPLSCRPELIACQYNQRLEAAEEPAMAPGRYVMTIDPDGDEAYWPLPGPPGMAPSNLGGTDG